LEKVIRELCTHGGHASVYSIYYDSVLLGIVRYREELAHLLRLAEHRAGSDKLRTALGRQLSIERDPEQ
jgi:hypothetical protein